MSKQNDFAEEGNAVFILEEVCPDEMLLLKRRTVKEGANSIPSFGARVQ